MRNLLFVGCGGSGGAILGYLMDQLRSDLQRVGIDSLPGGWGFVHIDCPPVALDLAPGLGTVWDLGGRYLPLAPGTGSYAVVDRAVTSNGADQVATWAHRDPESVFVPVQDGAGQQRTIGRILLSSQASRVHAGLTAVVDSMKSPASKRQMSVASKALKEDYDQNPPYTFVLSSMAGGTGASIALDVCRLLSGIVDPLMTSVFMCSPDVFDSIPANLRMGVRPNALAMLGEIVATQLGEATIGDVALFGSVGAPTNVASSLPMARVIPVGRFLGTEGTPFGDGSMRTIYRGVGQCLAAIARSKTALREFDIHVVQNFSPRNHERPSLFCWGVAPGIQDKVQWGSLGFASISMGRDRYEEYAAQRLARTCLDHLVGGHLQKGDLDSSENQAKRLLASQWGHVCRGLGLPAGGDAQELVRWVNDHGLTRSRSVAIARSVVDQAMGADIPIVTPGLSGDNFVSTLLPYLQRKRSQLAALAHETAYAEVHAWTEGFGRRVQTVVEDAIADHGLVYAKELVFALDEHLKGNFGTAGLAALGASSPDGREVPTGVTKHIGAIPLKAVIGNGQQHTDQIRTEYERAMDLTIRGQWCTLVSQVLADVGPGLLAPLGQAVLAALRDVEAARGASAERTGLATVRTTQYALWPSDGDLLVDSRWSAADNEVLLTVASDFPGQYDADIAAAAKSDTEAVLPGATEARRRSVHRVLAGQWPTASGQPAPGGLLAVEPPFVAKSLPVDPATGRPQIPTLAQYEIRVAASDVLDRARQYVRRPGQSFTAFIGQSIRDYARSGGDRATAEIMEKFREVLTKAVPFAGVNPHIVDVVHDKGSHVNFIFSSVPFGGLPLARDIDQIIAQDPSIDNETSVNFAGSLGTSEASHLDVFGYYSCALPVVYSGLLEPTKSQWSQSLSFSSRQNFWTGRRSRPLPGALAMGEAERRAMVGGWFAGQLTGQLAIPAAPYDTPVRVWAAAHQRWLDFPHPLLTPPEQFRRNFDWLPAVLEAHLVAVARFGDQPVGGSMAPYEALRGLWDDSPDGPTATGAGMFHLRVERSVKDWLRSGMTPPGPGSRVPGLVSTADPEERRRAAVTWLQGIQDLVAEHFSPSGRGEFARIDTAEKRYRVPIFRDLTGDLLVVLPQLVDIVVNAGVDDAPRADDGLMSSTF